MTSRAAAARYARALFDVVRQESGGRQAELEKVQDDLAGFAQLVASHESLARALSHPAIPAARKRAVVEQLLARAPGLSPVLSKLLLLLAERDRLTLLPDLLEAYGERLRDHQQVVRAEVTTAAPLQADRVQAIERNLAKVTGRKVALATRVDPSLIGGLVARIGTTVYDGSVTTQLQKMKQKLVESV
jgi:F-type H+-transporting ATPase subunit delta